MASYKYKAVNQFGKIVKGSIAAVNELDLEKKLEEQGCSLLSSDSEKIAKGGDAKLKSSDLIMLCVHMEQLDKAGVPMLDSLGDLRDTSESDKFKGILSEIYESVKNGEVLSQAMKKMPKAFDSIFVGLIEAGEKTGDMSSAFGHLAHHIKWNTEFKRSIKKAMRYPIALLVVMFSVITIMMTFVVPKLVDFLDSQGFDLPGYTRALISTSAFFVENWLYILITPILFFVIISLLRRTSPAFSFWFDSMTLKMPFIGPVVMKINLSRFVHFFAITFSSGIGVLECLETAKNVVNNKVLSQAVNNIIQNVSDGSSITNSLIATDTFPNLVIRMFKVGEDSGNMDSALKNINFFYEREVNDAVEIMVGSIQPILTVVLGGIMFWIIAAVFGPLYQSFSNIDF